MAVTPRTLAILLAQRAALNEVTDRQARALAVAWARAWDEISADMQDAIEAMMSDATGETMRVSKIARMRRANRALRIIATQLETVAQQAGVIITADAERVIRQALGGQLALLQTELPPGATVTLNRVDPQQVAEMVTRTTEQITARTLPLSADGQQVMRRELMRSVAAGDNPRVAARRMIARTQDAFNGGRSRALTIARTEILDAYRRAGAQARTANPDVVEGWQWSCDFSARTCPACLSMHGERFPADVAGPEGHQNCRCAAVPVTKTWREMGFDLDEPPSALPDANEWFESQGEATQRRVLGPSRYEAWKAGDYPMDKWARRRHTEGWRDSYVPSPVPSTRSLAEAS